MDKKYKILFICGSNSCRSIIAEFITNEVYENIIAKSAGIKKSNVNPYAHLVLAEIGIDSSSARSKNFTEVAKREYDYVITLCESIELNCPILSQDINLINKPIDGPSKWAKTKLNEQEKIDCYRKTRDEISLFVDELDQILNFEDPITFKEGELRK